METMNGKIRTNKEIYDRYYEFKVVTKLKRRETSMIGSCGKNGVKKNN